MNCLLTEIVIVKFLCYFQFGRQDTKALIVTCGFDLKCVGNILTLCCVYMYIIYVCVCVQSNAQPHACSRCVCVCNVP